MRFLEDIIEFKPMKIGITSLLSNITTRPGSHKGGWARLLKCQLHNRSQWDVTILNNKHSLHDFDVIIFDLGAEYSGALNLFGGLDEKVFKRLSEIKDYKGAIYSWRNDVPDVTILESRRTNVSTCEAFKSSDPGFLGSVSQVLGTTKTFDHVYRTKNLLIGDSHTPSVWTPDFMIERRDGRTLKGLIQNGTIHKYLKEFPSIETLHVHCSSIDVRHHINREDNPDMHCVQLATALIDELLKLPDLNIVVNHTMGIEDESRELPKTGYFKGVPFSGSWERRNRFRQIFNAVIDELPKLNSKATVVKFPQYFFDESGKLRFDVMEVPQSIHLSTEHYRWDLDKNELRWTESHDVSMQSKFACVGMAAKLEKDLYGT